jgi:HK97 family phage major capsid protein
MPFNDVISRTDAAALIPAEVSNEIIKDVAESNPLLQLARRLPNMSRAARTMPVMSALATAYFVSGDTGLKQTTDMAWANVNIHAEELAAIVPIPEAVLDDADYDIWSEVRPEIVKALNVAITQAVLYGTNIPASWTADLGAAGLVARATAAGHLLQIANYLDTYEAILGETQAVPAVPGLFATLEADGYAVSGSLADISMKGKLRNIRDVNGNPIFKTSMQGPTSYELDGTPLYFPLDGTMIPASSLLISGDWSKLVYAMRQDITYKVLDQAVIQDAAGNIVYNLAQQDMVALRAVIRLGFALPNPINRQNANAVTRCPFAVLID